jgi:two-component system chemotaxis response regulator CheB
VRVVVTEEKAVKGRVIVIGASFNGIAALSAIVRDLPGDLRAAVLIVQHTTPDGPGLLPKLLSSAGPLLAAHPHDLEVIEPGRIYVAPPDRHLVVRDGGYIHLSHGPKENRTRPALDATLRSAALVYGPAAVGVVLTGHLDDGTAGLLAIKDHGGVTVVQEPSDAAAPSMPTSALRYVAVDYCRPVAQIAALLVELANDAPAEPRPAPRTLLEIENRIAEGTFDFADWREFEKACRPTGLNCPDCRSALYELNDPRLPHFRCRAGHAYAPLSLLSAQAETRDDVLASVFGALLEEASIARRLACSADAARDPEALGCLSERIARLEERAAQIRGWLGSPLVEGDAVPGYRR